MSSLAAINKTLLKQNKLLKESVGGSATAVAKAAEDKAESKTYDTEVLSTLKSIRDALGGSAGGGGGGKDGVKKGGMLAGLMRGLGGLAGGIIKMVSKIGVGFIKGMGSLALGIGAFMLGLGGAAKIADLVGFKGDSLKALVGNVFGAFSGTDLIAMGAIIGAAMGMEKFKISKLGVALGMGAIGMGIAAFVLGILAAEGFSKIGTLIGLDGKSLASLMTNVFGAFSGIDMKILTGLLVGAVVLDKVKGGKMAIMRGMLALGGGIASFTLGILAAEGFASIGALLKLDGESLKTLLGNFFETFEGVDIKLLGVMLVAAGVIGAFGVAGAKAAVIGMGAIGAGVAAFTLGLLVGEGAAKLGSMLGLDGSNLAVLLTNLGKGIGGFVGGIGKGMFEQLKDLDSEKLKELGAGIAGIGIGIAAFSAAKIIGGIGSVVSGLTSFFGGESPIDTIIALSKDKDINAPRLAALGEAIGPLGKGIAAFGGFELSSGFFSGESDLEKFIDAIAKIGNSDVVIDKTKMENLAKGITPLATAMAGFAGVDVGKVVGYRRTGKNDIDVFFESLSGKNVSQVADKSTMETAAAGITPLAKAMASFGSLDLDNITGGLGEDNLTKFFEGLGLATKKIKKPELLKTIGLGISDLAKGLKTFANIDSDSLVASMNVLEQLDDLDLNDSRFAAVLAQGQQVQESRTMDFAQKSAMNVSGGNVTVMNDNKVINNDNRNSTISQTSVAAKIQPAATKE